MMSMMHDADHLQPAASRATATMKMAQPNTTSAENNATDGEDVGTLIYRESQLRKAEVAAAATAAAERKKRTRTSSTRKGNNPTVTHISKRKRPLSTEEGDVPNKVVWRGGRRIKICATDGCTNVVVQGGVCVRHGAEVKRCSEEGCPNIVVKGGVCISHGAKKKQCSKEGCTNQALKGGVCIKHGAKHKRCSSDGCTNRAVQGGVCWQRSNYAAVKDAQSRLR